MGSFISNLMGSSKSPSSGGVGGIDDLKAGLQDQSNELLVGMGPTREARQTMVSDFTKALAESANGTGPSLAGLQMRQAQDRSLGQQLAAARSNRAVNPNLAFRQTQRIAADGNQQIAQASGIARLQEQQQARNQFANFIGQQHQMSAQARTGALGGAQAAANINAADAARGDRIFGTLVNTVASGGASAATQTKYDGGMIQEYADGGRVQPLDPATAADQFAKEQEGTIKQRNADINAKRDSFGKALQGLNGPGQILDIAGGRNSYSDYFKANQGAMVPGEPVVQGDAPVNDTVPAMLSPGEIVIKRSVVANGPEAIKDEASKILKAESKKSNGFESVLAAQARLDERMKQIEAKFGKRK
jgi:hypothetical protein